jgi:hypothetical protein
LRTSSRSSGVGCSFVPVQIGNGGTTNVPSRSGRSVSWYCTPVRSVSVRPSKNVWLLRMGADSSSRRPGTSGSLISRGSAVLPSMRIVAAATSPSRTVAGTGPSTISFSCARAVNAGASTASSSVCSNRRITSPAPRAAAPTSRARGTP